jgi:hypothetical protein
MPLLYESTVHTRKLRPKLQSRSLQEEAPFWRVVEVYEVDSIYMTAEQLKNEIKKALDQAAAEKGLKVLSYRVVDVWAEWRGVYTAYFCRYEAIFGSASSMAKPQAFVAIGTIIVVLAIVVGLLIILAIVLVAREAVEAVFQWVPPEAKPYVATLLLVGLGLLVVGGGVYLIKSVIPKIKRK